MKNYVKFTKLQKACYGLLILRLPRSVKNHKNTWKKLETIQVKCIPRRSHKPSSKHLNMLLVNFAGKIIMH